MNHAGFQKILDETIEQMRELSIVKGGEYAGDVDRLENFKRNAIACGCSPELVWRIYAGKHWDSITQYIQDVQNGKDRPRSEPMEGRVDDLIVYGVLLKCMMRERNDKSN